MSVMDQFSVVAFPWGKEIITVKRITEGGVLKYRNGILIHRR